MITCTREMVAAFRRAIRASEESTGDEAIACGILAALQAQPARPVESPTLYDQKFGRVKRELDPQQVTDKEEDLVNRLGQIFNDFGELPEEHINDRAEITHHIHVVQRMILARSGRRQLRVRNVSE